MRFPTFNRRHLWVVPVFVLALQALNLSLGARPAGAGMANEPPLLLDVTKITVENTYVSPGGTKCRTSFAKSPVDIQQWANQRLRTPSATGTMAGNRPPCRLSPSNRRRLLEVVLPVSGGIKGFKTDQSERYEATFGLGCRY